MSEPFEKAAEQIAAFQKLWGDSMTKLMQAAFTNGQDSPPPEILKQIRAGIFQALAQSWDEFLRSPQFLEGMKQWMDNAIKFRQMSKDFMANVRNELQAPSREDLDSLLLTVRHMERQVLERIDALSGDVRELKAEGGSKIKGGGKSRQGSPGRTKRSRPRFRRS